MVILQYLLKAVLGKAAGVAEAASLGFPVLEAASMTRSMQRK
jgi:hypothetical protein